MGRGMKVRFRNIITYTGMASAWLLGVGGCSTTELKPVPVPTLAAPDYIRVPHPAGFDLVDVRAIFATREAPAPETLKDCSADFLKLKSVVRTADELQRGTRELVKNDPVRFHWCFYGKLLELEASLKATDYLDVRQKSVLSTYEILVPVAKAYLKEYRDSRYLRWAIRHYRNLSQFVFFQKLDQTPQMTAELTEVNNPFGVWREPASAGSVLEKYGIIQAVTPTPSPGIAPAAPSVDPTLPDSEPVQPPPPAPAAESSVR